MQFVDEYPVLKLARITGPHHNFLSIRFSEKELTESPVIEDIDPQKKEKGLIKEEVLEQVMFGVALMSSEMNQKYYVEKVEFLSGDTQPVSIYKYLATEIVRRVKRAKSIKD